MHVLEVLLEGELLQEGGRASLLAALDDRPFVLTFENVLLPLCFGLFLFFFILLLLLLLLMHLEMLGEALLLQELLPALIALEQHPHVDELDVAIQMVLVPEGHDALVALE